MELLYYETAVPAGFPSPALDYLEEPIDLGRELIRHPLSTFIVECTGDSMMGAFIPPRARLLVDRSLTPVNGNIVVDLLRDNSVIAMGQLRDALLGAGYTLVIASFFDGHLLVSYPDGTIRKKPKPRGTALLTSVETFVANTDTDSMRRRLNGRGV